MQHLHSVHVKSIQVPVLILLVTLWVVDLILFIRGQSIPYERDSLFAIYTKTVGKI